jgi:large subunit ribosomal protein L19
MNKNIEEITKKIKEKKVSFSKNLINLIEVKFLRNDLYSPAQKKELKVGDIIRLGYKIPEGDKERIQFYEGLVISKNNRGLGKSFTIRRNVQGIGIEQIFLLNSPKITSITIKQSSKVRRAKLYFIRSLSEKATRLKLLK